MEENCCHGGGAETCGCGARPGQAPGGLENSGTLDALAHDTRTGKLLMAMYETRPWEGGEEQLFQLQEKLNAYLSFALDGELEQTFPHLAHAPLEIQLRTRFEPSEEAWGLIARIREQLELQDIAFEVIQIGVEECPPSA